MAVFWFLHLLLKVQDHCLLVFAEEPLAFGDRGDVRWTGGVLAIISTPEHAFHAHPLGDHDALWVDPPEIGEPVLSEKLFQPWLLARC
jgi:hypothetical protein